MNDRSSFEEFVGLGVINRMPAATTVGFFRERLRKAGVIEDLVEEIKAGMLPEGWDENPDRMHQKDLEASWVQQNGTN